MSGLPSADDVRARLRRHLERPAPGIILLEFQTLPQLRDILSEITALHHSRPEVELAYDPARENAVILLARARAELARQPSEPLPLLVLRPAELPVEPLQEPDRTVFRQTLHDFWRAMNFRREAWGELHAQILFCVDPVHHEHLVQFAADLRDWAMPKLHLVPPSAATAGSASALAGLTALAGFDLTPAAAEIQWQSLWPAFEKARQPGPLEPGHVRRYVLPLLEAALAQGNLVRARQVGEAAAHVRVPEADQVEWHRWHGYLAAAEGDFARTESHLLKLLELIRHSPAGQEPRGGWDALFVLGSLLSRFGHNDAAEANFRYTVALAEQRFGAEHPDTLTSRNNLAIALRAQGRYADSELENRTVLAIRERVLGPEHPETLTSRNNLAVVLDTQGKHVEAEREHRAVIPIQERVLGADHPETLGSRNNLAIALLVQGKHAEAEQEHRAVLAIRERVVGPEHPDSLHSVANLALALEAQGKKEEAKPFAQRAYDGGRLVFGEQHPYIPSLKALLDRSQGVK